MSHKTQQVPRPGRLSRSNTMPSEYKEQVQPEPQPAREKPYCPLFQPSGLCHYKIALPTRPLPGQTPWPRALPPCVGGALGEATNRPRHSSMTQTSVSRSSSGSTASSSSSSSSSLSRSKTVSSRYSLPPPAAATVATLSWSGGLNPLLAPGGGLLWTLRCPTSYIKTRASSLSTPGPLTYTHRAQPAQADQGQLVLVVALPGSSVRVHAGRLGDLIDTLSAALNVAASAVQWAAADQRAAASAYRARCGADTNELAKGIKRIDLLGVNAAFAGLVPSVGADGSREWVLRVVVAQ